MEKKSRVNKYVLVRLWVGEEKNSAKEPYDGYIYTHTPQ